MTVSLTLVGGVYLLTGIGLLALLWKAYTYPEKPSTEGFVVAITAAAANSFAEAINLFDPDVSLSLAVWYCRVFGTGVTSAGWVLLAVGFSTRRFPSTRVRATLYGYILLLGTALAVDATLLADSVFVGTTERGWANLTVQVDPTWGFWIHAATAYLLTVVGVALFLLSVLRERGLRRKQAVGLVIAGLPATTANVLIVFGVVSVVYDITIFGFAGSMVLFTVALYRMSVLDLAPVARQTAMEEMDDAVLTLDEDYRIVDCNAAARTLFGLDESEYFGQSVADCCGSVLVEPLEATTEGASVETQVTLSLDGTQRHFSMSISPISASNRTGGRVVVLRDITPIKRREEQLESREEELDLLRQVFSRVLRHNLRNELTVIHGSADDIATRAGPPIAEQAELICESSEDLIDISQKARYIERIIDSEDGLVDCDLRQIAVDAAEAVRQRYPEATIEVVGQEECSVLCNAELEAAVENLIENAVEHNTNSPRVRVEISEHDDTVRLTVADNGPGIADEELAVLEEATETQLSHGSGIGLWLVKWVVEHSNAELTFETGADGTDATIHFPQSTAGTVAA